MESVQTKEFATALGALTKHKNRSNRPQNVVVQPTTVVENPTIKIEAAATSVQPPANPPVTPEHKPEPQQNVDTRDYKEAWVHLKTKYDTEVSKLRADLAKANIPQLQLPKTPQELEEYRKKYPEAMDVFTTVAMEAASKTSKELEDKLAEITKFQNELKDKEAFKKLLEFHPDAMEIRSSVQFEKWYNEQPSDIQKILSESTDVKAVAKQLKLYKLEVLGINPKGKNADEVKETVDASLGVEVKGRTEIAAQKKIWTQTEINQVCANFKTFEKYRVELDEARQEGRVDYTK